MGAGSCGKDECWLILHAEDDARIGLGLKTAMEPEAFNRALHTGTIAQELEYIRVEAGDFFYIPANTIHTVGKGIVLLEIQQNCDITFRLYDFGRSRELHWPQAEAFAHRFPCPRTHRRKAALESSAVLVNGPYFSVYLVHHAQTTCLTEAGTGPTLVVPLDQPVAIGTTQLEPGECGLADHWQQIVFSRLGTCIVVMPAGL